MVRYSSSVGINRHVVGDEKALGSCSRFFQVPLDDEALPSGKLFASAEQTAY
jgi:hypothetical protein